MVSGNALNKHVRIHRDFQVVNLALTRHLLDNRCPGAVEVHYPQRARKGSCERRLAYAGRTVDFCAKERRCVCRCSPAATEDYRLSHLVPRQFYDSWFL